jgi:hypothetical protein
MSLCSDIVAEVSEDRVSTSEIVSEVLDSQHSQQSARLALYLINREKRTTVEDELTENTVVKFYIDGIGTRDVM